MKAHVDLSTGEIHGCKPGSLKYLHEEGHIVFNSNDKTSWMIMVKSYVFDIWMLFIMGSIIYRPLLFFATALFGIYTFITIYEELWCNKYAKLNYEEEQNGNI